MSYVIPLQTDPPTVYFGVGEQWTFAVDTTNELSNYTTGTTPTAPTYRFVDLRYPDTTITLADDPSVTGMVVSQQLRKSTLIAGHTYQYNLYVTPSTVAGDVVESVTTVFVPPYS